MLFPLKLPVTLIVSSVDSRMIWSFGIPDIFIKMVIIESLLWIEYPLLINIRRLRYLKISIIEIESLRSIGGVPSPGVKIVLPNVITIAPIFNRATVIILKWSTLCTMLTSPSTHRFVYYSILTNIITFHQFQKLVPIIG